MFIKAENVFAVEVWFAESKLFVRLADGREIGVPIDWFPKLRDASSEERNDWRLIGQGQGIHWEALDEDLSGAGLLKA
jgi:hypothetical protein